MHIDFKYLGITANVIHYVSELDRRKSYRTHLITDRKPLKLIAKRHKRDRRQLEDKQLGDSLGQKHPEPKTANESQANHPYVQGVVAVEHCITGYDARLEVEGRKTIR